MNAGLGSPTARSADRRATVKNEEEKNSDAGAQRLKRKQTAIACVACQKRKSKCDGRRPTCSLCEKRMTKCEYDGSSASRRLGNLRRLNNELTQKIETYEAQIAMLRSVTSATEVKEMVDRLKAAGEEVAATIAANRHMVEAVQETPLGDFSEDVEDSVQQTPNTPFELNSFQLDDSHDSSWREALVHVMEKDIAVRPAPRDYIEIFGERWAEASEDSKSATQTSRYPFVQSDELVFNGKLGVHLIQPRSTDDRSPLSRVCSDYKIAARKAIAHGVPAAEILGPSEMDVSSFLNNEAARDSGRSLPRVDRWASLVNKSFEDVDVFVLLASVYLHWSLMRWMIHPTLETYASLPNIVKPTLIQLFVPHVHALNFLPLPSLRDFLMLQSGDSISPVGASLSCNWGGSLEDCLERDMVSSEVLLSPKFREHVVCIENWSVSPSFIETFPELEGLIRVESDPVVVRRGDRIP